MRRKVLAALALASVPAAALAQTADELVAKLCEARGGIEKLRAVQSVRMSGHMELGNGIEAPVMVERKRPHQTRMELTFQGATSVQAYDGRQAWGVLPMGDQGPAPLPPEMARDIDEQADIEGPLIDYKAKGHQLELVGREQLDRVDVWRLKLQFQNGDVVYSLLDAATHLEVATETRRLIRDNEVEIQSRLADYKEVGGVLWPHKISAGPKGRPERQTLVFDKIEVNPPLDDELFRMPAAPPAPAK
jgi:hypothetical protein